MVLYKSLVLALFFLIHNFLLDEVLFTVE